jgi:hypothetical protein
MEEQSTFACSRCNYPLTVEYAALINLAFTWEDAFGKTFTADAKSFYGIGIAGKSPDGGWPSMTKIECANCQTMFLVYAGVNEASNSVYFVTMQGITELRESENS